MMSALSFPKYMNDKSGLISRSKRSSVIGSGLSLFLFTLITFFLSSCSHNYEPIKFSSSEERSYLNDLATSRLHKDIFLKTDLSSPLSKKQKAEFKKLNYYPPNLGLLFRVKLLKLDVPESVGIQATGGEVRRAKRYGKFEFEVGGKKLTLSVYKMEDEDADMLFLPLTDRTCDSTQGSSYAGGRYIDLKENDSGSYTLDFNYAYNPYCAYSHSFSCPIVPQENHLDVAIAAGEMKY